MSIPVTHQYTGIEPNNETSIAVTTENASQIWRATHHPFTPVTIYLTDDIDVDIASSIAQQLQEAEANQQPFVCMHIQSRGGCVYSLLSIVESMRQCSIPIYTFVTSLAASSAACIFACGQRRFMGRYAKLLLHDVSVDFPSDSSFTTSNIKVEADEMRSLNRTIFRIMAESTGKPKRFFMNIVKQKRNNDIYVDAKKALAWDLATDIGVPNIKICQHVEMICEVKHSSGKLKCNYVKKSKEIDEEDQQHEDANTLRRKKNKRRKFTSV
jgi:ATP-dependent protease ClpP protease subunit